MSYLIHSPAVAIRSIDALTGTDDAPLGSLAMNEDGDKYVLTAAGWLDVTSTAAPEGSTVTVQSGDGTISIPITIENGVAVIPEGYTLAEDA